MSMFEKIEDYLTEAASNDDFARSHWAGNGAVAELEKKLCLHYGAKHALCVDSATNGMMYLLLAAGLKHSEILTTSLGFGGTIAGALLLGCKFHFTDIDATLNIDSGDAREIVSENRNIKAVISVDFAGNPHDIKTIHKICHKYDIWHFVDSAQSLGADYGNMNIANQADAIDVSFGSGKAVFSGGEGGAIVTNNTSLYNSLVSVCQHPHRQSRDLGICMSHEFALNGRISPLAAIVACESFESGLAAIRQKRESLKNALAVLSTFKSVTSTFFQLDSAYYHCPFIVSDQDAFIEEFKSSRLSLRYYYTKASFVPIPCQLELNGLKDRIITSHCPKLEQIVGHMYLLHINKQ